jgi:hypothetical protein
MIEARIGGVMVLAESAGQRSAYEWALLLGAVCAALGVVALVEWINAMMDERSRR